MPDQPRTVDACGRLREECQGRIFEKMDKQHKETLDAIGELKGKMAYREGAESVASHPVAGRRVTLREACIIIAMLAAAVASAVVTAKTIADRAVARAQEANP